MSIRAMAVRLLAVPLAAVLALTAAPAPASTPAEVKYGNKIHKIVNDIREKHDRVQLKRSKCLQRFANRQAQKMANQRKLFHQDEGPVIRQCGLSWYGENVAYGQFAAKQMVQLWMNSTEGHRENILRGKYRLTGVAARKGGGYWWAAQVFGRKG